MASRPLQFATRCLQLIRGNGRAAPASVRGTGRAAYTVIREIPWADGRSEIHHAVIDVSSTVTRFRATGREILMADRLKPLAFARYAWVMETEKVQHAGSGILVAPQLALSAKHVTESFDSLDEGIEARKRRRTHLDMQYRRVGATMQYANRIYQYPIDGEIIDWATLVDCPSHDTDITALIVEPRAPAAMRTASTLKFLEWQLLPPHIGATVYVVGWPNQDIRILGDEYHLHAALQFEPAKVTDHIYPIQAHGFGEFPGFRIYRELDHGFSGGARFSMAIA